MSDGRWPTVTPQVQSESLKDKLASRGIRLTKQRRFIIDMLEQMKGHLHASDLLDLAQAEDEKIDRATVYRTLSLLKSQGLIDELDLLHLDGSEHHYEISDKPTHIHIGCTVCGRIVEYSSAILSKLEAEIKEKTGFMPTAIKIEVAAKCQRCRS